MVCAVGGEPVASSVSANRGEAAMRTAHRPRRGRPAIWLACHQGFYQGESRMLDSLEGICAGQVGLEYPATSVPFSKCSSNVPESY